MIPRIVLLLLLAGCRTGGALPWEEVAPDQVAGLEVERQDMSRPAPERFELRVEDARRIAARLADARPLPGPPAGQALSTRSYRLRFRSDRRTWRMELPSSELLVLLDPAGKRWFAPGALPGALRAALDRARKLPPPAPAGPRDDLAALGARLQQLLDRQRELARAEQTERALLFAAVQTTLTPWPGRSPIEARPGRVLAVGLERGARSETLELPAGVRIYPSYGSLSIVIDRTGALRLAADRTGPLDAPDPEALQPYPAHFDLVLERPGSARKLYVDLRPAEGELAWRVYP